LDDLDIETQMLESSKKGEEEKADEKKSEKQNEEKVEGIALLSLSLFNDS